MLKAQEMVMGQGSLAHCSPWSRRESDMSEWLNNNNIYATVYLKYTAPNIVHFWMYIFLFLGTNMYVRKLLILTILWGLESRHLQGDGTLHSGHEFIF